MYGYLYVRSYVYVDSEFPYVSSSSVKHEYGSRFCIHMLCVMCLRKITSVLRV